MTVANSSAAERNTWLDNTNLRSR